MLYLTGIHSIYDETCFVQSKGAHLVYVYARNAHTCDLHKATGKSLELN